MFWSPAQKVVAGFEVWVVVIDAAIIQLSRNARWIKFQTQNDEQSGEVQRSHQPNNRPMTRPFTQTQSSNLVFSPAKLGLEPEECLLVWEKESLKRSDDPTSWSPNSGWNGSTGSRGNASTCPYLSSRRLVICLTFARPYSDDRRTNQLWRHRRIFCRMSWHRFPRNGRRYHKRNPMIEPPLLNGLIIVPIECSNGGQPPEPRHWGVRQARHRETV